ncbi:2-hydroxyacid dehydrogenase [Mesorhizobium sp. M0701]|uniref:2-hydroxyacid dehydrogenase n=1 Tax=Mesorhizobium sp. M0701 TaxID=2956989 RepID=UPI00333D1871
MKKKLVLMGDLSQSYGSTIEHEVSETWELVSVDATGGGALMSADAIVTMIFNGSHSAGPRLKMIQVPAIGVDGIDFDAVPIGTTVCNAGTHEIGCAEYVLLGMLEWAIRLSEADKQVRKGDWSRSARFGGIPSGELFGKSLLIVGLGGIGRAIAERASAFGMKVTAVNRSKVGNINGVETVYPLSELQNVVGKADFVAVSCALTEETRGLISRSVISCMGKDAVLINVARGDLVDEEALWESLTNKRIGGAILDVWWRNPSAVDDATPPSNFHFEQLDSVIMSPHIAGWTEGTRERRGKIIVENLRRMIAGETLSHIVKSS